MMAQDAIEAELHERAVAATAFELRLLVDKANAPIFIEINNGIFTESATSYDNYLIKLRNEMKEMENKNDNNLDKTQSKRNENDSASTINNNNYLIKLRNETKEMENKNGNNLDKTQIKRNKNDSTSTINNNTYLIKLRNEIKEMENKNNDNLDETQNKRKENEGDKKSFNEFVHKLRCMINDAETTNDDNACSQNESKMKAIVTNGNNNECFDWQAADSCLLNRCNEVIVCDDFVLI